MSEEPLGLGDMPDEQFVGVVVSIATVAIPEHVRKVPFCVYCGDYYQCRDHVVPVGFTSVYRNFGRGETVHCCNECNHLAGAYVPDSFQDKAAYLLSRYEAKYKKILNQPIWQREEIKELKNGLKRFVESRAAKQRIALGKLRNLDMAWCGYPVEPLDPIAMFGCIPKNRGYDA